jgi:hypothetical protein
MNNLAPVWCTGFVVDHLVGEHQDVRVTCVLARATNPRRMHFTRLLADVRRLHLAPHSVQDFDGNNRDGTIKGDPLGSVEMSLDDITKTGHHGLTVALMGKGAQAGSMINVMWEDASSAVRGTVTLTLKGTKLANRCAAFGFKPARCHARSPI